MSSPSGETYRLEAFADAVFAIAITSAHHRDPAAADHDELVQNGGLGPALLHLWPSYLGYLISFVVIGIMWANHYNLMKLVDRVDHGFITLNLVAAPMRRVPAVSNGGDGRAPHRSAGASRRRGVLLRIFHGHRGLLFPDVVACGARPALDRGRRVRRRRARDHPRVRPGVAPLPDSDATGVRPRGDQPGDRARVGDPRTCCLARARTRRRPARTRR